MTTINVSRSALRSTRALRQRPASLPKRSIRFESTSSNAKPSTDNTSGALIGGLVGGGAVAVIGYTWYHFSGAKSIINAAHQTKSYFDNAVKKTTQSAPAPNEAINWLRQTAGQYAMFVPGAKQYVDKAFDDLEKVQQKHGGEVNKIVNEAYQEIKGLGMETKGFSIEGASKAWSILQKYLQQLGDLAQDAAGDIMENHPQLKEKVGGNLDQLKKMGEQYGPDAKKQVDETWGQVQDILKGGIGVGTVDKIQKLVKEKVEQVRKLGDQAWDQGMEKAKPLLEKQPQLKQLVEQNIDKLKQNANLGELFEKAQKALSSGDTKDLEQYVKSSLDKAKQGASQSFSFDAIPGGGQILSKVKQLQDIAQKHGGEAEKLLKDTFGEIQQVVQSKVEEGEKLAEKAEKDAKS